MVLPLAARLDRIELNISIDTLLGASFIGSALIRHTIRDTGESLVNIDKLTYVSDRGLLAEVLADPRSA